MAHLNLWLFAAAVRMWYVRRDFPNVLTGCCDVVATKKGDFLFWGGNARHPLKISHERLIEKSSARRDLAHAQPDASLLRNIGSDVVGLGEQRVR